MNFRLKNITRLAIGHLNNNLLRHKFDQLKQLIKYKFGILVITKTKLDCSFPNSHIIVDSFRQPNRYNGNRHGRGVMIFIRKEIPRKVIQKINIFWQ